MNVRVNHGPKSKPSGPEGSGIGLSALYRLAKYNTIRTIIIKCYAKSHQVLQWC